jgi:hypothetical protein
LTSEGCTVSKPRYPLLHEQPFFTEGAYKKVLRLSDDLCLNYEPGGFPNTREGNELLIKFPCFTSNESSVLDEYIHAINKIGSQQEVVKGLLENEEKDV